MTKPDKSNEQAGTGSTSAKSPESEQMLMQQTIVTSRKIVIDEATGKVRFADEEGEHDSPAPAAPADAAAAGENPDQPAAEAVRENPALDKTVVEVPPEQIAELRKASEQAKQPETASQPPAGNKRLSSETLFAFALPEAVLKEEMDKIKKAKANEKPAPSTSSTAAEKPREKGSGKHLRSGVVIALLLVAAYVLYHAFGPGTPVATSPGVVDDTPKASDSPAKEVPPAGSNRGSQAQAGKETTATRDTPPAAMPSGPINKETVKGFSVDQLIALTGSDSPDVLSLVVEEAVQRKDRRLLSRIVDLASNENYVVRVSVVKAFGEPGTFTEEISEKVGAMLLERLGDEDELVRGFAARALGATGEKSYLTALRGRLDEEKSEVVLKIIRNAITTLESSS